MLKPPPSPSIISPKQAVTAAAKYLRELANAKGVFVEEAELDGQKQAWHVTLSHDAPGISAGLKGLGASREYKAFIVNARTGEVMGMKIRKI